MTTGKRCAAAALGVGLATVTLLVTAQRLDLDRLHVNAWWNDQTRYVSAARSLLATGRWDSNWIHPALLPQNAPVNFLYMPGHIVLLAGAYAALGYSAFASLAPNLLAFAATTAAATLIAQRVAGAGAACVAAVLTVSCPYLLLLSFTAMSEPTFTAVSTLALAGVVLCSGSQRVVAAALGAAAATLFRDTGVLLCVPMAILARTDDRAGRTSPAWIGAFAAAALASAAVLASPVSRDRPSQLAAQFCSREALMYWDAVGAASLRPSLTELAAAAPARAWRAAQRLWGELTDPQHPHEPRVPLVIALAAIPLLGLAGVALRIPVALAAAALLAATFATLLVCYFTIGWVGVRHVLFAWPLACAAIGAIVRAAVGRVRLLHAAAALGVLGAATASLAFALRDGKSILRSGWDAAGEEYTRWIVDDLRHDPNTLLVGIDDVVVDYLLTRWPARAAMTPYNRDTFELLDRRYPVGTIILTEPPASPTLLTAADLGELGFVEIARRRQFYLLVAYRRPARTSSQGIQSEPATACCGASRQVRPGWAARL